MRRRVTQLAAVALGTAGFAAGCAGDEDDYENRPRPPAVVNVTAAITDSGVSVSPPRLGAGPVQLIVTNLTDSARELTLETNEIGGTGGGVRQSTGKLNPGDTAELKAELKPGSYEVRVEGARPTPLRVGAPRPSAQGQLLQP